MISFFPEKLKQQAANLTSLSSPSDFHIMVVDDEPDILYVIRQFLEKWGFHVDTYSDPIEALHHFKKKPAFYSLVVLDIRMPGMDGFELAEELIAINSDVKLMVVTAFYDILRIPLALMDRLDREHVLEKPLRLQTVCQKVRRELSIA